MAIVNQLVEFVDRRLGVREIFDKELRGYLLPRKVNAWYTLGAVLLTLFGLQILTGVLLAVAGAAGNSAPLLFTALFSNYYLTSLTEPTASLAILIFNFSGMPYDNQLELAWAASLVLVLVVLVFNILARIIGRQKH